MQGNILSMGSAKQVTGSFEYGLTASYGNTINYPNPMFGPSGNFGATITGLLPGTTYHYRAKLDGGASGVGEGQDVTFTTLPPANSTIAPNLTIVTDPNGTYINIVGNFHAPTDFVFRVIVANTGYATAGPSKVSFSIGNQLLGKYNVSSLAAGQTTTVLSVPYGGWAPTPGKYVVTATVDADNQVIELNEKDNSTATGFDVLP
jgi:hypothetical protein